MSSVIGFVEKVYKSAVHTFLNMQSRSVYKELQMSITKSNILLLAFPQAHTDKEETSTHTHIQQSQCYVLNVETIERNAKKTTRVFE